MHTKLLIRPENFVSRYQQWHEDRRAVQLEMLRGSYANELFGSGADDIRFEQEKTHARLLWQPEDINIEDLGFILDHFRDIMLKNNYYNNLSDERLEVFDSGLKLTVHRHYLKPDISFKEIITPDTSHLYGNLFLEHHFNSRLNTFSISTNYYSHKQYLSYEKLMELLLG